MPKFYLPGNFENITQYRENQQRRQEQHQVVRPTGKISIPSAELLFVVAVLALVIRSEGTPISNQGTSAVHGITFGNQFSLVTNSSRCDLQKADSGIYALLRSLNTDLGHSLNDERSHRKARKKKNKDEISKLHNTLYNAVVNNDVETVKDLLMYGLNVDEAITVDFKQYHLLPLSILKNHYEMVEALLIAGANPHKISNGIRPLTVAVCNVHPEIAELLVTYGATFADQNPNVAITLKNSSHYLADREYRKYVYYPLHLVIRFEAWKVPHVINLGADVNKEDYEGLTPLHYAARYAPQHIALLVQRGANVNASISPIYLTPLQTAVLYEPRSIIPLVKQGANINLTTGNSDYSALMLAAMIKSNSIAILLDLHPNLDTQNGNKDAAIHLAIIKHQETALELLVAKGANINLPNGLGETPLHLAIEHWPEKISFLMEHGASSYIRNNKGKSPVELLADQKIILEKKKVKLNLKSEELSKEGYSLSFYNYFLKFVILLLTIRLIFIIKRICSRFTKKEGDPKQKVLELSDKIVPSKVPKKSKDNSLEELRRRVKELQTSVSDTEDATIQLSNKKRELFNLYSNSKNEAGQIYRKVTEYTNHESDQKFVKKHAANINNIFGKLLIDHLQLASKTHIKILNLAYDIKADYKNLDQTLNDTPSLSSFEDQINKLLEKIKKFQSEQEALNKEYLMCASDLNSCINAVNTSDKAITSVLSKREKNTSSKQQKVPLTPPLDQPLISIESVAITDPAVVEELTVKPAAKETFSLPPQVLDDRHIKEHGNKVHDSKPIKDFVLPDQLLIAAPKLVPAVQQRLLNSNLPPNLKLFENINIHALELNTLLHEIKTIELKPGELDTFINRYSCSFSLFQLMHNTWLLIINLKSRKNLLPHIGVKLYELYTAIKDFRHMLAHLPDNFELSALLITAKQCIELLPLIATLSKVENNGAEIRENDISTLINAIKKTDLYQYLSRPWANRKQQYPNNECLLKIGHALQLIPNIAKVFSHLAEFLARNRMAVKRKQAISMLMLIAGEYIKRLDKEIKVRISKLTCYIEVNQNLFEKLISYRKLVAHLPEEEHKNYHSNQIEIDQQVFNFAILLTKSESLTPLIKLFFEDAQKLITPERINLSPPLPAAIPVVKLNPKAPPFRPLSAVVNNSAAPILLSSSISFFDNTNDSSTNDEQIKSTAVLDVNEKLI